MTRRKPTVAERKHMGRVAALGCIACEKEGHFGTPAEIHHLRHGQGVAQRSSHYRTLPLCPRHHRLGNHGVAYHAGPKAFEAKYGTELELLAEVLGRLAVPLDRQPVDRCALKGFDSPEARRSGVTAKRPKKGKKYGPVSVFPKRKEASGSHARRDSDLWSPRWANDHGADRAWRSDLCALLTPSWPKRAFPKSHRKIPSRPMRRWKWEQPHG